MRSFLDKLSSLFKGKTWDEVLHQYDTPREICRLVQNNIRYMYETKTAWRSAPKIWELGYGDCKDFAVCIQALCRKSSMETRILIYFESGSNNIGHAIVVGTHTGAWSGPLWYSSNGGYKEVKKKDDMEKDIARMLDINVNQMYGYSLDKDSVDRLICKGGAVV